MADSQGLPAATDFGAAATGSACADLAAALCRSDRPQDIALCTKTVARVVRAIAEGNTGLKLEADPDGGLPEPEQLHSILRNCGILGAASTEPDTSLLCALPDGSLTLAGFYARQRRIADQLTRLAETRLDPPADAEQLLQDYFPGEMASEQRLAAALAMHSRLTLITGGPGTGKTTAVTGLASMFLKHFADPNAIAMAAFTGRAAMLMSARRQQDGAEVTGVLEHRCFTLHRLLGLRGGGFSGSGPAMAGLKVLILDEASMLDTELTDELLAALPPDCRLILVGDSDQLPPIGAGAPFIELCSASTAPTDLADRLDREALAKQSAPSNGRPAALARLVRLSQVHRFKADSAIADLARLILQDPQKALEQLDRCQNAPADAEIRWLPLAKQGRALLDELARPWLTGEFPDDPQAALQHLAGFRVLSSRRTGPWGSEQLNRQIAARLAEEGRTVPMHGPWPLHTPVLIERNDPLSGLNNGELGVMLESDGRAQAFFPRSEAAPLQMPPALLPKHSCAWAMTVHKSQGSEYDRVALVLSGTAGRHLTRELLYTACTRARQQLLIAADPEQIRAGLTERTRPQGSVVDLLLS